jgi:hypothetical protein
VGLRTVIWFALFSGYWFARRHQFGNGPPPDVPEKESLRDHPWKRIEYFFTETRFRQATRDYRTYVRTGWGLDTWVAWPFIESEFTDREQELHVDALATVHFFQNASLGAGATAVALLATAATDGAIGSQDNPLFDEPGLALVAAVGCAVLAYGLYCGAVEAVREWGQLKIVSVLRHRGDVYRHLGLRQPVTFADEIDIANAANDRLISNVTPAPRQRGNWTAPG